MLVVSVLAFLPGVSDLAYWDDGPWPRQLPFFASFGDLLQPPTGIPDWPYNYFRPVWIASLLLDARLFDSPLGGHVMNLAYHAVTSLLVFLLARRLLAGQAMTLLAATLAAAVFAVHPIHAESVCWVGARVDILATLFSTLTILLALAWRDSRSVTALLLTPLAFLLAVGAKEVGIVTAVLTPLAMVLAPRPVSQPSDPRAQAITLVPLLALLAVATAIYLGYRADAADRVSLGLGTLPASEIAIRLVQALGYYLQKLLVPWPQSNFVVPAMLRPLPVAGLILLAGMALTGLAVRRWWRTRDGVPLFGLLMLAAGIAPALLLAVSDIGATPVAERYLYFPSAGAGLALAAVLARGLAGPPRRQLVLGGTALLILIFLASSLLRSQLWSSNVALWADATRQARTHALPFSELGSAWQDLGDDEQALAAFSQTRGLEGDPATLASSEYNAGLIWLKRGDYTAALAAFRAARSHKPDYPLAHYGLGRVYQEQAGIPTGRPPEEDLITRIDYYSLAQRSYAEAIRLNPSSGETRLQLIRVLLRQGDLVASAGRTDDAQASYRAARQQLEAMLLALPDLGQQPGIADLRTELAAKAGP